MPLLPPVLTRCAIAICKPSRPARNCVRNYASILAPKARAAKLQRFYARRRAGPGLFGCRVIHRYSRPANRSALPGGLAFFPSLPLLPLFVVPVARLLHSSCPALAKEDEVFYHHGGRPCGSTRPFAVRVARTNQGRSFQPLRGLALAPSEFYT